MAIGGAEEGERVIFGFRFLPSPVTMKGCSGSRKKRLLGVVKVTLVWKQKRGES